MIVSRDASAPPAADVLAGFMTPEELATALGRSLRTLARWHAERKGPARCKVGGLVLYRIEAVQRWMIAHEQEPPEERRRR
jgi:hypothetical protein